MEIKVNAQWEVYAVWALILIPILVGIPLLLSLPEILEWKRNRWIKRLAKSWDTPKYVKAEVLRSKNATH